MDDLADVPVTNLESASAGFHLRRPVYKYIRADHGAATQIRIRGVGSFNASVDPVYVIDGVPIISGNVSGLRLPGSGLDILATIEPL
ncbi:MAG: hypothetical protein MZV63_17470 [Marinilabiliales bacterium]|nr:hypothetical protein [Marinilabiliales bacterium]